MAATYTPVSLADVKQVLGRGYRAYKMRQSVAKGETVLDLHMAPHSNVGIRIWTSVGGGRTQAAGRAADAIRVGLISFTDGGRGLKADEKLPIVKRTQNWRSNLRKLIDDALEEYDDREGYWEQHADPAKKRKQRETRAPGADGSQGAPPTEKQLAYAMSLVTGKAPKDFNWTAFGFSGVPSEEQVGGLSRESVAKLVKALLQAGGREDTPAPQPAPVAQPKQPETPATAQQKGFLRFMLRQVDEAMWESKLRPRFKIALPGEKIINKLSERQANLLIEAMSALGISKPGGATAPAGPKPATPAQIRFLSSLLKDVPLEGWDKEFKPRFKGRSFPTQAELEALSFDEVSYLIKVAQWYLKSHGAKKASFPFEPNPLEDDLNDLLEDDDDEVYGDALV